MLTGHKRDRPMKESDGRRHSRNGKEERAVLFPVITNSTLTRQQVNGTAVVCRTLREGKQQRVRRKEGKKLFVGKAVDSPPGGRSWLSRVAGHERKRHNHQS